MRVCVFNMWLLVLFVTFDLVIHKRSNGYLIQGVISCDLLEAVSSHLSLLFFYVVIIYGLRCTFHGRCRG